VFDPAIWAKVPFHFWTLAFFVFGSIVGSFLNVCIYRMPIGLSVVNPPSHCPHCKYSIPWYLNVPLLTWVVLQGKCKNCKAPIAPRYFLVELLTGVAFMLCWLAFGAYSWMLALVYCLMLAGFITATFIDFEHYIIPDEITIGGIFAGVVCSFIVPVLQMTYPTFERVTSPGKAVLLSVFGAAVGWGLIYAILRLGKLMFGKRHVEMAPGTKIIFTETGIHLPNEQVPYEDVFYRDFDTIHLQASKLELVDRCYFNAKVELQPSKLRIGEDEFVPEEVHVLEAVADELTLPREAMGLGDVKFMAAIGAFLGAPATIFSLAVSSVIGAAVGLTLIATGKREWSTRLPYGPYIAAAAIIWIFGGWEWVKHLFSSH
jgi:leader peptidase (prepilin peptidase) / N-methyltransferase